jgi:O-antigen ligase
MAAVAALHARDGRSGRLPFAGRLPAVAAAALALGLLGLVVGALGERGDDGPAGEPSRLTEVGSRRYDYWRVALDEYTGHPIGGLGSGGFRAAWRRERTVNEGTLEVHSLPIEMGLELGLPGLLGYFLLVGGVGVAAVRALSSGAPIAAGASAAAVVWLIHSTIDWDWQVPAVTLPALLLAGALVAASEPEADPAA